MSVELRGEVLYVVAWLVIALGLCTKHAQAPGPETAQTLWIESGERETNYINTKLREVARPILIEFAVLENRMDPKDF